MPKLLLLACWTFIVAAASFTAGRLMQDEPASSEMTNAPIVESYLPATPVVVDQTTVAPVKSQLPRTLPAKSSYAGDYEQLQLLLALAATNPALAMEKARQLRGVIKEKAHTEILDIWGAVDPNGAWSWVQSNQPENNSQFIKLLESIGRKDPRSAVSFAEKFAENHREFRKDIYMSLISGLTQNGSYRMATDLVGRLDIEPETKTGLFNSIVSAWANYEPQAALQWLMTQHEEVKTENMERLVDAWSDANPQDAVSFVASQHGANREALLLPAFKKWMQQDAFAAVAWLSSTQSHKDFDGVIAELATQPIVTNGDAKAALSLAGRVQDPELRMSTVTSILSAFKQKDPHAAAVYLQEITYLTDAERVRLLEDLAF